MTEEERLKAEHRATNRAAVMAEVEEAKERAYQQREATRKAEEALAAVDAAPAALPPSIQPDSGLPFPKWEDPALSPEDQRAAYAATSPHIVKAKSTDTACIRIPHEIKRRAQVWALNHGISLSKLMTQLLLEHINRAGSGDTRD